MDFTHVETATFERMLAKFESFVQRVTTLCQENGDKRMKKWLNSQEVCQLLNISKRSLQTYRDNGTLPYSQVGHKMYYKSEDIERLLTNNNL